MSVLLKEGLQFGHGESEHLLFICHLLVELGLKLLEGQAPLGLLESTASVATSLVLACLALHLDIIAPLLGFFTGTLCSIHVSIGCVSFGLLSGWLLLELGDGQPLLDRLSLQGLDDHVELKA